MPFEFPARATRGAGGDLRRTRETEKIMSDWTHAEIKEISRAQKIRNAWRVFTTHANNECVQCWHTDHGHFGWTHCAIGRLYLRRISELEGI